MGTRADFYIQTKTKLEYLGSIGWDGYPSGIDFGLLSTEKATKYRDEVKKFFSTRDDVSLPKRDGWPWPWENSNTTDFAYVFIAGEVYVSKFGSPLFKASEYSDLENDTDAVNRVLRRYSNKINSKALVALTNLADQLEDQMQSLCESGLCLDFPDMTKVQKVAYGKNSGLIAIGVAK